MRRVGNRQGFALSTVLWVVVGVLVAIVVVGIIKTLFMSLLKIAVIVIITLFVLGLVAKHSENKESK